MSLTDEEAQKCKAAGYLPAEDNDDLKNNNTNIDNNYSENDYEDEDEETSDQVNEGPVEESQTDGGKKSKRKTKKRRGNEWTRLVTKTFKDNKSSKEPEYHAPRQTLESTYEPIHFTTSHTQTNQSTGLTIPKILTGFKPSTNTAKSTST